MSARSKSSVHINNVRVTCTLSSEHIIWTSKRVSGSTPSWRSWSSSLLLFFFFFLSTHVSKTDWKSSSDILLCPREKKSHLTFSAKIIKATRTTLLERSFSIFFGLHSQATRTVQANSPHFVIQWEKESWLARSHTFSCATLQLYPFASRFA